MTKKLDPMTGAGALLLIIGVVVWLFVSMLIGIIIGVIGLVLVGVGLILSATRGRKSADVAAQQFQQPPAQVPMAQPPAAQAPAAPMPVAPPPAAQAPVSSAAQTAAPGTNATAPAGKTKFCTGCGAQLEAGDGFCGTCGREILV